MKEKVNAASPAYLEIIDFIAAGTTPRTVIDFRPSPEAQEKIEDLTAREKDGSLLPQERQELDHFMELEHILRMAKAKAREILSQRSELGA